MTLSLAPHKKTLDPPMVNHFRNKIVSASAQRNVHIIQILYRVPPKTGLFRGDFLFVRRKCHARVTSGFFFRSSRGFGRLFTYNVLAVILAKQVLHLKLH